jgi:hypothetical protein
MGDFDFTFCGSCLIRWESYPVDPALLDYNESGGQQALSVSSSREMNAQVRG